MKGKGAVTRKQALVEKLLVAAKGEEIRYLIRTLSQHIRVGATRTSVLTALARTLVLTPLATATNSALDSPYAVDTELITQVRRVNEKRSMKGEESLKARLVEKFAAAEALLKRVYVQHPNYDDIVAAIIEEGLDGLSGRVPLTVGMCTPIYSQTRSRVMAMVSGIPLQPTLGSPVRSLDDVYERIGGQPFTAEFKYDGQRVQIHAVKAEDGKHSVNLFSRHLEDMTEKVDCIPPAFLRQLIHCGSILTWYARFIISWPPPRNCLHLLSMPKLSRLTLAVTPSNPFKNSLIGTGRT